MQKQFDFVHLMEVVNYELKKQKKPLATGFELNKQNPREVRFFDADDNTVWLPQKLYEEVKKNIFENKVFQKQKRLESEILKATAKRKNFLQNVFKKIITR